MRQKLLLVPAAALILVAAACDPGPDAFLAAGEGDLSYSGYGEALQGALQPDPDGLGFVTLPMISGDLTGFDRVGVRFDGDPDALVEVRVSHDGAASWSGWAPLRITWSEGDSHSGHADVAPGAGYAQLRFRVAHPEDVSYLIAELFQYTPDLQLEASVSATRPDDGDTTGTLSQLLAADGVAVSRSSWGARATRCTSTHSPSRVTIHHTVTPNNDSWDMPRRMRQIQSYHMDTRGWCDVGYHFLVGQDGKVYQGRVENKIGAHVAGNNTSNLGVSFIGDYSSVTPSQGMFDAGGRILKSISRTYGIALNRTKIKGHREYAATACPGTKLYAKMDYLISLAQGSTGTTPSKGFLKGAIFWGTDFASDVSDTSKRISGATVKLAGGQTVTTDASGYYTFELAPGSYTATASKSGYSTESVTKSVTAGATTWGSIMLTKSVAAATGTVKGFVFWGTNYDTDKTDTAKRIGGATVTFSPGGRTVRTDASGLYQIDLAPGTYEVHAAASGYLAADRPDPVTVAAGAVSWGSVMLGQPTQTTDTTPPVIAISAPSTGATLDLPSVQVVGTVSDQSPIDRLLVNGADATLQNGGFSATVTLTAGENTLRVEATDDAGNVGSASVQVTYAPPPSGVLGFVYDEAEGPTARVVGAQVVIETMEQRHEAVTDATGAFSLDGAPGTWAVSVTADGYLRHVAPVEIVEGTRRQIEIALQQGTSGPEVMSPVVEISYPIAGEVFVEPEVVVTGSAGVEGLTAVEVNGQPASLDADTQSFSAVVSLEPGMNDLVVVAFGEDGEEAARATVSVEHTPAAGFGCATGAGGNAGLLALSLVLAGLSLGRRPTSPGRSRRWCRR